MKAVLAGILTKLLMISVMADALIILILLVKALFRERLSARWHYYIWLLLVVRLIIPYTPEFSAAPYPLMPTAAQEETVARADKGILEETGGDTAPGSAAGREDTSSELYMGDGPAVKGNEEADKGAGIKIMASNIFSPTIPEAAGKIWLLGVFLFIGYILLVNMIMNHKIRATSVSYSNAAIRDTLEYCKKLAGIKTDIPVVYQRHIKTPAICGAFKPRLLIPADMPGRLDGDEIRYVLLHELCHFKRRDTLTGMLQMLLCVLHWFNPLVWCAFKKMKEDREPVCDELVLSYLNPGERRNYAETLIKILKCFSESHWVYGTADMSRGSAANMEWRLKLINILKKRSVILGVVIAFATIASGTAGVLFINGHLGFSVPSNMTVALQVVDKGNSSVVPEAELPVRGKILDRNGRELAVSIPADTVTLSPLEIKAAGQDAGGIAQALADFLSLEKEKVLEKATANSTYEIIARNIDRETGDKIRDWIQDENISGVIIEKGSKRVYPNNKLAAHVIGFTGSDGQGLAGIEQAMEESLKLKGGDVSVEGKKTLTGGANVVLTIDAGIQAIAESALHQAIDDYKVRNGAAAVIMDPRTGEILAMASGPDFDPNLPYLAPPGADPRTWKGSTLADTKLLADTVWRNKALEDTFEPSSAFKAITAAMALEEGIIRPDSRVDDGPLKIDAWTINCWRQGRLHGKESFEEAFLNSCNPVFAKLALSLGKDKFYRHLREFGFYDKTGLLLPGEAQSLLHENPGEIDMAVASLGQRFQITPVQLADAYSAIANGGRLMKPQIIKRLTGTESGGDISFEPQLVRNVLSGETAGIMKALLEGNVSKGTAENAYAEGYGITGCIGTGEKAGGTYTNVFAGFAPADDPEIACVIVLDGPSGASWMAGVNAAPAAGKLMKDVLDYLR